MADVDENSEHGAFENDFSEYYEGTLAPARRDAVEAHLAGCARCRAEYDKFREAAVPPSAPPAGATATYVIFSTTGTAGRGPPSALKS